MGKKFTPERLANIRRMRKARRLYRKEPVFAFATMLNTYPDYTHEQFLDDLRYRKPPKRRKGKAVLLRYGRYQQMLRFLELYKRTENVEYAIQAQRLRSRMTKPYRVLARVCGETWEYNFDPTISLHEIERLTIALSTCKTVKEVDKMVEEFRNTARLK